MEVDSQPTFDYDLFVIGGGSGGISAARWAAQLGARVALADFVQPTPSGSKWGLGGTCVNVGCIPKKLMHYAALCAEARHDQVKQGWAPNLEEAHNWETMRNNVQSHIKGLNWQYKTDLMKLKVKYFNAFATFKDAHTIRLEDAKGKVTEVTAGKIVIAVGGRPSYPEIEGAKEFGITSDDMFSLKKGPGKTLVVGASYVALECAGFLAALGYDTTVMVRSILLRGFDQDMAEKIGFFMDKNGTKFIHKATPSKLEKLSGDEGPITVTYNQDGKEVTDTFDSVLFAMGRYAITAQLNLANAGLVAEKNGKFNVNDEEQTNVPHIHAIGDVINGQMELTPTAIKTGQLLARRLFAGGTEKMDYINIATTVFTPLEYGCCGYSEADAKTTFGEANIKTYHTTFQPLEWQYNKERVGGDCYVKVLVDITNDKVVGFHILSPSAGEISQGIGIAMKCNLTKTILDSTVGIHPTIAEEVCNLRFTKEDDGDVDKGGC